jgi:hypothetical protein
VVVAEIHVVVRVIMEVVVGIIVVVDVPPEENNIIMAGGRMVEEEEVGATHDDPLDRTIMMMKRMPQMLPGVMTTMMKHPTMNPTRREDTIPVGEEDGIVSHVHNRHWIHPRR